MRNDNKLECKEVVELYARDSQNLHSIVLSDLVGSKGEGGMRYRTVERAS